MDPYPINAQHLGNSSPIVLQCVDAEILRRVESERTLLQMQLAQKCYRETALAQWHAQPGQGYFTHTANGVPFQFTHFLFEAVYQITFDPLFFRDSMIGLVVKGETPIFLTYKQLSSNKSFLAVLFTKFGSKITPLRSDAKLASLLRGIVYSNIEFRYYPYFSGWEKKSAGWEFKVFPGFNTRMPENHLYSSYEHLPPVLPAAASLAVRQMLSSFEPIQNPALRTLLFLWVHLAFLQTPLRASCIQISQILYLASGSFIAGDYLKKLFLFGDDAALALNSDPDDFVKALGTQKDRTTVIHEKSSSSAVTKNMEILSLAMERGTIKLSKKGCEKITVNVATLPVILGSGNAMFSRNNQYICIEFDSTDFDTAACKNLLEGSSSSVEYWFQFASKFEKNNSLWEVLEKEQFAIARELVIQNELPRASADLLCSLLTIEHFLHQIYDDQDSWLMENIDWKTLLIDLLLASNSNETALGASDMFIQTAHQMLQKGDFLLSPSCQSMHSGNLQGTVYYDAESFYFVKAAFERVCSVGLCPCNATKKALRKQGYLVGPFTNQNSYSHRLRSYTVYGEAITIPVFRFKRHLFEKIGEPSIITEEGVWTTS